MCKRLHGVWYSKRVLMCVGWCVTNFFKKAPDIRNSKRLKRVSKKRQIINIHRKAFVEEQLAKRPHCEFPKRALLYAGQDFPARIEMQAGCTWYATEIHEPLSRARKPGAETILDAANTLAGCSHCHAWTHAHPALAEKMGLLKSSRGLTR